ncbi:MAG: hypothetical protein K4571_15780 [Deltaproteobacteria bacterium]
MKFKLTTIITLTFLLFLSMPAQAKNVFKAGDDITIEEGQDVDNIVVLGGQVTVNGLVEKNILAIAGSAVLTNKAVVRGNVIVVGGVVARGSGSLVFGDITEINSSTLSSSIASALRGESEGWSLILNIISLCFFAIILMIALIMTLLIPRSLAVIANAVQANLFKSFLFGFLATLMIVPFFMLLAISIIGIVLIPVAFTALLLAAIVGFIAFGSLLGNVIITRIFHGYKKSLVKETLVGISILWVLGWIPFYIGMLIKAVAITFGLGGVLLTLCRRKTTQ